MKSKITAQNRFHLGKLIEEGIRLHGKECDLNHIDVSQVTDMTNLFYKSKFNGDISQWNVSGVRQMDEMFFGADFNGDISKWDVSNVTDMFYAFKNSRFSQDLSDWKPYRLGKSYGVNIFHNSQAPIPYWSAIADEEARKKAIDAYVLAKELHQDLNLQSNPIKKPKI